MKEVICKDCIRDDIKTVRSVALDKNGKPVPGNRCTTHHREFRKRTKASTHERRVLKTYSLAPGEYAALYEAQDGKCFICQRATGMGRRKLAVDHDHSHCPGPVSCGECVRSLLCSPCNRGVLGHLRDNPWALRRAIEVIEQHPAREILQRVRNQ